MRKISALLAALIAIAVCATAIAQQAPLTPAPYSPGVGDLMHIIVQPRHLKLGLAGQAGNWPLAEYELKELRLALAATAKARPVFKGLPLAEVIAGVTDEPVRLVGEAIKARDAEQFTKSYASLTESCNACHTALDHAFVVIKRPDQSSFPNQEFAPAK